MRSRLRRLDLPLLSQFNWNNPDGNKWCGRTSASMIYNYYVAAYGGGPKDFIVNQYDKEPYNLVYPGGGGYAAYNDAHQAVNGEPLERFAKAKGAKVTFKYERLWKYVGDQRKGGPPTGEQLEQVMAPILDQIDANNPVLFASGLSRAAGKYVSHFIVISGYEYDPSGDLCIWITDPATNHGIIKQLFPSTTDSLLKVVNEGRWGEKGNPAIEPSGSVYRFKASLLFLPNPLLAGKGDDTTSSWGELQYEGGPAWGRPPGVPLLCDNDQSPGGFAVCIARYADGRPWEIPDNERVIADRSVSWPVSLKKEHEGNWLPCIDTAAPYPIGASRTWHSGVLFQPSTAALSDERVNALAKGTVAFARFPKEPADHPAPSSSAGMVLLRHEFDPETRLVLEPRGHDENGALVVEEGEAKNARDRAIPFYSFYLHLAPLSELLENGAAKGGVTPPWLIKLAPEAVPAKRHFIPADTQTTLSTWGDTARTSRIALAQWEARKIPEMAYEAGSPAKIAGHASLQLELGGAHLTLASNGATQKAAFAALAAPTLPSAQDLTFYNPLTDQLIPITKRECRTPAQALLKTRTAAASASMFPGAPSFLNIGPQRPTLELDVVKTEGSTCWVALAEHMTRPGFQYKYEEGQTKGMYIDSDSVSFSNGTAVPLKVDMGSRGLQSGGTLTGPTNKMRFSVKLSGSGPYTELRPRMIACVQLTKAEHDTAAANLKKGLDANVPRDLPLKFLNAVTEEVVTTSVTVGTSIPLTSDKKRLAVALQVGEAYYVGVPDHTAVLDVSRVAAGAMRVSRDDVLTFDQSFTTIKLYCDTSGAGASRYYPDKYEVSLSNASTAFAFPVADQPALTGLKTKYPRVWVGLRSVAQLTRSDVDRINRELSTRSDINAILDRLEDGHSRLAALELSGRWQSVEGGGGLLEPVLADAVCIDYHITQLDGALKLVAVKGSTGSDPFQLQVTSSTRVMPVYTVKGPDGHDTVAYIELFESVPKSSVADNQSEIDAVKRSNTQREQLMTAFRGGAIQDLRGKNVRVGREWIGKMGAAGPGRRGVHVECFCGENLVDPNTKGTDDKLVPVPSSSWFVLRDDQADGQFKPEFVRGMYAQLVESGPLGLDVSNVPSEALECQVGTPANEQPWIPSELEWRALCETEGNTLILSQIVSAHASYWTPASADVLKNAGPRAQHIPQATKDAIKAEIERLAFWKSPVVIDGKGGSTLDPAAPVFHFHPMRLVEWLNTGVSLHAEGDGRRKKAPDWKPTFDIRMSPQGRWVPVPADKVHPLTFHFRTVVGVAAEAADARLKANGFDTAVGEVPLEIRRGELKTLSFVAPHVTVVPDLGPRSPNVPVDVRMGKNHPTLDLLADAGLLPETGLAAARVEITASFNQERPTELVVTLSNAADFQITAGEAAEGYTLTLAEAKDRLTFAAPAVANASAAAFTGMKTLTCVAYVTPKTKLGKDTVVKVECSGGDFPASTKADSPKIRTREIKAKMEGDDVSKLMVLLSQIPADDHQPCYRLKLKKSEVIYIDGQYGPGLASALWRFAYTYASDAATPWAEGASVKFSDRNAAGSTVVSVDDLKNQVGKEPRLTAQCVDYPIVDEALLGEIVKRFDSRYVTPEVDVSIKEVSLAAPAGSKWTVPISIDLKKVNQAPHGKCFVLPLADDQVDVTMHVRLVDPSIDLTLMLEPADPYHLVVDGSDVGPDEVVSVTSARPDLALKLRSTGTVAAAEVKLLVKSGDGSATFAELVLPGMRTLSDTAANANAMPGRDIALLQLYLSQVPETAAEGKASPGPCWRRKTSAKGSVVVDGVYYAKEMGEAIARFKATMTSPPEPYPDLVLAARDAYLAAIGSAATSQPETAPQEQTSAGAP